jgi:hypothetical protein
MTNQIVKSTVSTSKCDWLKLEATYDLDVQLVYFAHIIKADKKYKFQSGPS